MVAYTSALSIDRDFDRRLVSNIQSDAYPSLHLRQPNSLDRVKHEPRLLIVTDKSKNLLCID